MALSECWQSCITLASHDIYTNLNLIGYIDIAVWNTKTCLQSQKEFSPLPFFLHMPHTLEKGFLYMYTSIEKNWPQSVCEAESDLGVVQDNFGGLLVVEVVPLYVGMQVMGCPCHWRSVVEEVVEW